MYTYSVLLARVMSNAGPLANFRIQVQASNHVMAKMTAEAQYPGYAVFGSPSRVL